ncbi:lytic polysaccharide monooxygenase [Permianibacter aggregans]|uniref:Chitin-binding protein n=1 Tax=Permianibacter aggregans TaxID=1510150 RepID=A0A4R6USG3_9GAMM|nr:lytic polysaccharide monooxygenase [Permianibacter aggregans]QGX39992.1 hypothetical protein E2H98_10090 [Permianibacter aggregans]TDQ49196.1 chitin-binding protein [Permianibacter aggregans]
MIRKQGLLIAGLLAMLWPALPVQAHGYTHQPLARQQFCARDGGYWWPQDGSGIPNAACRAAFLESGTFQFVQNIEYSANVANYNSMEAVKAVVADQTLCAAGDNAKRGMNIAHAAWQRTVVTPDNNRRIEVLFYASTPHNPSFWEFYLSKPGFDAATQRLRWADLDRIASFGNTGTVNVGGRNMYRFEVPLPAGRSGDAVLFTRWQRQDAGGEGFYNCSDIRIAASGGETWFDGGEYIRSGTVATVGDEIWFRVFDNNGDEKVFEKLPVTASNQNLNQWAAELATRVNTNHASIVRIGVRQSSGQISFDGNNIAANRVWLASESDSSELDVKKPQGNLPPQVSLQALYSVAAGNSLTITPSASDPEGQPLSYEWLLPNGLSSNNTTSANLVLNPASPTQTTEYSVTLRVSDGVHTSSAQTTVRVIVEDGYPSECPSRSQLSNGCRISNLNMHVNAGSNWIMLWLPAGARNLQIQTSGGSGNVDLYLSSVNWPTPSSYQWRSNNAGNAESLSLATPEGGRWYYLNLLAVAPYAGVSVQASWQ